MENQSIISSTKNARGLRTPAKPAKKGPSKIFLAASAVLVVAGVAFLVISNNSSAETFNEDAAPRGSLETTANYASLEDFELEIDELSIDDLEEIENKISLFFTYSLPEIKTLTAGTPEVSKEKPEETVSEEENPSETTLIKIPLSANTNQKFFAELSLMSNISGYTLTILDNKNNEIYAYNGGAFNNSVYDTSSEPFLDSIITKLPYTDKADSGVEFTVEYQGADEDRLTISPVEEGKTLSEVDCENTLKKSIDWANSLNITYSGEITEANFVCE